MPSPNLPDVVLWSIPAFALLTVVGIVSVRLHPDDDAAGYATDIATHEYAAITKELKAAHSWRERAGRLLRGPGRQPAGAAAPKAPRRAVEGAA